MSKANAALEKVRDPILVLQGDSDPVVNPSSATTIYEKVGSKVKKLVLVPRTNHIIINSEGKEEVFESKYLSQIKFKKLGNDGFSLAYSGLKSPIPNENNMG